jgi:teichuronic acid biosynthesis glycosyltransferase TuaC
MSNSQVTGAKRHFKFHMRILTFTSLFPNAVQPDLAIFVFQRTVHLARQTENSVIVVAPVPYFPSWLPLSRWKIYSRIPLEERVGELEVLHPRYPLFPWIMMSLHAFLIVLGCLAPMIRLNKRFRFECIDAHFVYPDSFAAVLLGKILAVPVVVSARGTDINEYPSSRFIRPLIRWALRNADGVVAVSTALREKIVELGRPREEVRVITNGIDPRLFAMMDRAEARRHLGLSQSADIAVCVAALRPVKGHKPLIQAIALLANRVPKLQLYLVGEGPLRAELESMITELNLKESVFLVGRKPNNDLKIWFNAANVCCLTSENEGWPNVLSESLACGTPVVATRAGGIPEIIDSPELGILVESDAQSIANGLEIALSKDWDRQKIASQAGSRTWAAVAAEVRAYLNECVERWKSQKENK